jgi:hypothetical protein
MASQPFRHDERRAYDGQRMGEPPKTLAASLHFSAGDYFDGVRFRENGVDGPA